MTKEEVSVYGNSNDEYPDQSDATESKGNTFFYTRQQNEELFHLFNLNYDILLTSAAISSVFLLLKDGIDSRFIINPFLFNLMFSITKKKNPAVTFRHYDRHSYSAFNSLKREIRIGVLAVTTLLTAHNAALATRSNSLLIVADTLGDDVVELQEAQVTGSQLPVSIDKAWSKIVVISRQDIEKAKCQTINDVLKLCPNVDVRQRGAMGVQTDVTIGGGTAEQITFLLNGVNINNPQTGHLAADFPVNVNDIERIEVLDGASARMFGSQALNGIINIITRIDPENSLSAQALGGSYGTFGGGGSLNLSMKGWKNRVSYDYLRTDGATLNSAFNRSRLFYQGSYRDQFMRINWQAGINGQHYGANTFYSARYPNQWEEGRRYMAAVKAENLAGHIHLIPTLSFIRSFDHFQLIRFSNIGENFHRNDVFSAALSAYSKWALGRTAAGGELRHEGILSTNLGQPLDSDRFVRIEHEHGRYYDHRDHRTNISFFLEHAVLLNHWSLNAGVMANRNSAVDDKFRLYPGVDLSFRPSDNWKFYASYNRSMRMPTFTDLYYHSPTQLGNQGLKPEQANTLKLGADYNNAWLAASLTGLYRHGSHMIDWVMYSPEDVYHSTAFRLSNYQFTARAALDLLRLIHGQKILENFSVSYFFNHQKRHDKVEIYQSNYALDYLRHKVLVQLDHRIFSSLSASWYLRWQERQGTFLDYKDNQPWQRHYRPYTLLDMKLRWDRPQYNVYLSLENLLCRRYYDLGAVPQPRFTFLLGGSVKFRCPSR